MKNLEQFSAKVQYVTPSCKSVELRSKQTILTGSDPYSRSGLRDIDGEDVQDQTNDWGFGL